jgi:hypothetical protein
MKTQRIVLVLLCGVMVALAGHGWGQETPKVPEGWQFSFPEGNAKDGQTVFMRMECYSCHVMKGLKEKPPQGAGGIGPDLSNYHALPKEYLAESIIKAHTVVAAPGYVL